MKTAIILAGGVGARMGDVSLQLQKCLTPINNRPIIDYVVSMLMTLGFQNFIFVVSHLEIQVRQYISQITTYKQITLVHTRHIGTAGALADAIPYLTEDQFIYLHGDMYFRDSLITDMINLFGSSGKDASIAISPVRKASTHPHLTLKDGNIEQFYFPNRKELPPPDAFCSMETLLFKTSFAEAVVQIPPSNMVADLIKQNKNICFPHIYNKEWFHLESEKDLLDQALISRLHKENGFD